MRKFEVLVACIVIILAATGARAGQPAAPPAARVGAHVITAAELDRAVGSRTMRMKTEEYQVRVATLQSLVAEQLLRDEAARKGLTVDALLQAEVDAKVAPTAASDVAAFYESVKERFGALSPEEALRQITENLHRQRL